MLIFEDMHTFFQIQTLALECIKTYFGARLITYDVIGESCK